MYCWNITLAGGFSPRADIAKSPHTESKNNNGLFFILVLSIFSCLFYCMIFMFSTFSVLF